MKRFKTWLFLVSFALLFSSCRTLNSPLAAEAMPYGLETSTGYPPPATLNQVSGDSSYPAPMEYASLSPGDLPKPPETAPKPQQGKASITGTLYSYTLHILVPGTTFYLTSAIGDEEGLLPVLVGPQDSRHEIRGQSDDNGNIELNNIPPGTYYLIVWAPYNWSVAELDETSQESRVIELKPDQQLALGVIYLSWP